MSHVLPTFFVIVFSVMAITAGGHLFHKRERQVIWLAFIAHLISAFAQVLITRHVFGGGDMFMYFETAERLVAYLDDNLVFYGRKILRLILQDESVVLPTHVIGVGTSTGTMSGLTALIAFVTRGSIYATCLVMGVWALSGQIAIYRVMREAFPRELHDRMIVASLLIPSVVFWSSGVLKETIALGGFGWLLLGVRRLLFTGNKTRGLLYGIGGGAVVFFTKVYILFALVFAVGVWFYWFRTMTTRKRNILLAQPLYIVVALVVGMVAMAYLSEYFPQYSLNHVQEETARLQEAYYGIKGGSTYTLGDTQEVSAEMQVALAPVAFLTSLFRPFILEAHNLPSFVNSIETLVLLWLLVMAVRRRGLKPTIALITRSPFAMFCVVFVLVFGTAVGLGAPNLGSLSRYRVPMMPLYTALVLLCLPLRRRYTRRVPRSLTTGAGSR